MNLETQLYTEQVKRWPADGRHILAHYDVETIVVYQLEGGFFAAAGYNETIGPPTSRGSVMRSEDVREFLRRQPFQPFRLTLTDGRTYEVLHPELAMVGRSSVAIGVPQPDAPEPVYDRLVTVSLLHIMQIEPLESGKPS